MDNNHQDDIDKTFRDRFDGLKDHSIDPSVQWSEFEAVGSAPMDVGFSSSSALSSSWGVAASVAGLLGLAVFTSQDKTELPLPKIQDQTHEVSIVNEGFDLNNDVFRVSSGVSNDQGTSSTDLERMAFSQAKISVKETAEVREQVMFRTEPIQKESSVQSFNAAQKEQLQRMDPLDLTIELAGVEKRDIPAIKTNESIVFQRSKNLFVRAGGRTGTGESNSEIAPAQWRLNGLISVGYTYAISAKTFVSIEAGYLVRSGNGVERSRRIDLDPLFSMFSSSNGFTNSSSLVLPSPNSIDVRESLVATQMSFVHIPALVHVTVSPKSNASIGCYADYLLSVRNESYMVYNGQDYINADLGLGTLETKEGLNLMRLGLIAGYEHSITDKFSGDVRATLPITSIYDRKSDLYAPKEPNKMVDIQFSINYKI